MLPKDQTVSNTPKSGLFCLRIARGCPACAGAMRALGTAPLPAQAQHRPVRATRRPRQPRHLRPAQRSSPARGHRRQRRRDRQRRRSSPNTICASAWRCSSRRRACSPRPRRSSKLRAQVLDQLETEQLQIQEAKQEEHHRLAARSRQGDRTHPHGQPSHHRSAQRDCSRRTASISTTLRAQIAAQIAWQKAVEDEYPGPRQHHAGRCRCRDGAHHRRRQQAALSGRAKSSSPWTIPDRDAKVLKDARTSRPSSSRARPSRHGAPVQPEPVGRGRRRHGLGA